MSQQGLAHPTSPDESTPVLSPFTPAGIQHSWDNTSLTWAMDCPRKYYYSMIEGWTPRATSVHLTFGLEYHRALERFDVLRTQGLSHDEALRAVVQETFCRTAAFDSEHRTKNRPNLLRSIIWYIEEFADDAASTVVLANGRPAVELSFRIPLEDRKVDGQQILWCGHLDRVVTYQGDKFVMDRKTTTSSLGPYYFEGYDLDRQMTGYTYMGRIALAAPVRGVIIDAASIAVGGTNFQRGLTYRTEGRLEEWVDNTHYWILHTAAIAGRARGPHDWPLNETSCNKFRSNDPTANAHGCVFKSICNKDPSMREMWLESGFERRSWNPLQSRQ